MSRQAAGGGIISFTLRELLSVFVQVERDASFSFNHSSPCATVFMGHEEINRHIYTDWKNSRSSIQFFLSCSETRDERCVMRMVHYRYQTPLSDFSQSFCAIHQKEWGRSRVTHRCRRTRSPAGCFAGCLLRCSLLNFPVLLCNNWQQSTSSCLCYWEPH